MLLLAVAFVGRGIVGDGGDDGGSLDIVFFLAAAIAEVMTATVVAAKSCARSLWVTCSCLCVCGARDRYHSDEI